jgi:3-phenylpropionate/cinnamic acid dioxygenase small subunit
MAAPTTLKAEDKLQIIELSSSYNKTLDHRDIDGWLETWTEDGTIETPFGNSKGKTSLRVFLNGYFEIARGKRHWTSNYMISAESNQDSNSIGSANNAIAATSATMSCDLMVFKIEEIPTIFITGTYVDKLKKIKDIWKFSSRKLNLDSMSWHRTSGETKITK